MLDQNYHRLYYVDISALIGLVTWFFTSIYRSSSPQSKKKIKWGILILIVSCGGMVAVYSYLQSRPEAIAKRESENKALEAEIEAKKAIKEAEYKAMKDAKPYMI